MDFLKPIIVLVGLFSHPIKTIENESKNQSNGFLEGALFLLFSTILIGLIFTAIGWNVLGAGVVFMLMVVLAAISHCVALLIGGKSGFWRFLYLNSLAFAVFSILATALYLLMLILRSSDMAFLSNLAFLPILLFAFLYYFFLLSVSIRSAYGLSLPKTALACFAQIFLVLAMIFTVLNSFP